MKHKTQVGPRIKKWQAWANKPLSDTWPEFKARVTRAGNTIITEDPANNRVLIAQGGEQ